MCAALVLLAASAAHAQMPSCLGPSRQVVGEYVEIGNKGACVCNSGYVGETNADCTLFIGASCASNYSTPDALALKCVITRAFNP